MAFDDIQVCYKEIKALDNSEFIDQCYYKEYNFWPLIRFHYLLKFKSHDAYFNNRVKFASPEKKMTWLQKQKATLKHQQALKKLPKCDYLLHSNLNYYTDTLQEKKYNRLIDPWFDYLKSNNKNVEIIETRRENKFNDHQVFFNPPAIFDDRFFWMLQRNKRDKNEYEKAKNYFEALFNQYKIELNADSLAFHIFKIFSYSALYADIFKQTQPQKVLTVCWYEVEKLGMIAAAKEKSIEVMDVQHGKQGIMHPTYYHWKTAVKEPSLLPNKLLVWGNASKENINHVNDTPEDIMKPIITGNLWLSLWREKDETYFLSQDQLDKIEPYYNKKNILFALQPVATDLQMKYIEFAADRFPNKNIMLRFHPTMQRDKEQYLALDRFKNIDVETANELPLYAVFKITETLFTCWSTVCLECSIFGVLPVLIHENGANIFKKQIESQEVFYASSQEDLVNYINNSEQFIKKMNPSTYFDNKKFNINNL